MQWAVTEDAPTLSQVLEREGRGNKGGGDEGTGDEGAGYEDGGHENAGDQGMGVRVAEEEDEGRTWLGIYRNV